MRVAATTGRGARTATETRCAIASARPRRGPLGIETRPHRVLDVAFGEAQPRLRKGHGARSMAAVRHVALNLVRAAKDGRPIMPRRKPAG